METRKNQSDLSIEDLLNALDSNEDISETFISDPVFSFVQTFDIKQGTHIVKATFLYDLFKKWSGGSKMTRSKFVNDLKKYIDIEVRVIDKQRAFVNKSIVDLIKHLNNFKSQEVKFNHKKTHNHFKKFLEIHNITKGNLYIEADVFYHIYDTWTYRNKIHQQLSYERFKKMCELYFNAKKFTGSELVWYGVDDNIKQYISINAVTNWRQGRAKRGKKSKVSKEDEDKIIYPETQK